MGLSKTIKNKRKRDKRKRGKPRENKKMSESTMQQLHLNKQGQPSGFFFVCLFVLLVSGERFICIIVQTELRGGRAEVQHAKK
jgi:hypothetical protein